MSVSLRCSDCGTANPTEAHFCGTCGSSLSTAVEVSPAPEPEDAAVRAALSTSATPQQGVPARCLQCGHENPTDAGFCGSCGAPLGATTMPVEPIASGGPTVTTPVATAPLTSTSEAVTKTTTDVLPLAEPTRAFRCRRCGFENPPGTLFCANCGFDHSSPNAEWPSSVRGENAGRVYATFWQRVLAFAIDLAVFGFLSVAIDSNGTLPEIPWPFYFFAYSASLTALGGQTVGKISLHIRVVGEKDLNAKPDLLQVIVRECLVKPISTAVLGSGLLWVAFDGKKRGLHDIVAGTYVIKV